MTSPLAVGAAYNTLRLNGGFAAKVVSIAGEAGTFLLKASVPVAIVIAGAEAIEYYKQQVEKGDCGQF
ncbi:MAG TPA: hypothetical protein VEG30_06835 [Terriglobales bacterium]|nr:hypothetical protein [Terriglobales bacterium]